MSENGEAGQDDYGLPATGIQVPDDARELDRDVQAYRREQRALHRQLRSKRLFSSPLTRYGTVRPMIAGLLLLALLSGVLLVLFSAGQFFSPGIPAPGRTASSASQLRGSATITTPGASRQPGTRPAATGAAAAAGPRLPAGTLLVAGRQVMLRSVTGAAIALIGPGCQCEAALLQLVRQAVRAQITLYLVGAASVQPQLARLARTARGRTTRTATDVSHALGALFRPAGLTVLLVDARGAVARHAGLRPGFMLERQLASLKPSS